MSSSRKPETPSSGAHSIWGRVVDPSGGPVPDTEIFWVDATHAEKETVSLFDVHKVAHANAEARFWAPGLPEGPCLLVPDYDRMGVAGDKVRIAHGTRVSVPTQEEPVLLFPHRRTDFGTYAGIVTDQIDRRPASHLPVALFAEGGTSPLRQTETSTSGAFVFKWLRAGEYRLAVWGTARQNGGERQFELKQNARIDVQIGLLRRPPGPRASVRVHVERGLGLPIAGARVNVVLPNIHIPPKTTDADGGVEFSGLPERPVRVIAMAPGYWPGGVMVSDGSIDEPLDIEIVLEPTIRLRVEILDGSTGKPLRHANLGVAHPGSDQVTWGGVLPPPEAPPRDHHDVEVRPGPVTVRAAGPGFESGEVRVDVVADADASAVVVRLAPRGRS